MTAKAVTAINKNRLVFISFSLPCRAYLGAIIPRLPLLRKRMISASPKGNFEIGRFLHLKSEIGRYRIGLSPLRQSNLRFRNFGFEMQESSDFKISLGAR